MKLKWEYSLPTNEKSSDSQYESPILVNDDGIYYVSHSTEGRILHIIDQESGTGIQYTLPGTPFVLPHDYFFCLHGSAAVLYAGNLHLIQGNTVLKTLDFTELGKVTAHITLGDSLYIVCSGKESTLCCISMKTMAVIWKTEITNSKPYRAGELSVFDDLIACYGKDQLLIINPKTGAIVKSLKIPRTDKLFSPIRIDDNTILLGFTNWSNSGILKYQLSTKQVLWKHKRKFEGPQLNCRIYRYADKAIWVKNNTELIAVNINNGEEAYHIRTTPWLYTDLHFLDNHILYGTAGADGYFNCLDAETGKLQWSIFLKNGCAYYAIHQNTVILGDFENNITQVALGNGELRHQLRMDNEIVGQLTVSENNLYTVVWSNDHKPVRLCKISLNELT